MDAGQLQTALRASALGRELNERVAGTQLVFSRPSMAQPWAS